MKTKFLSLIALAIVTAFAGFYSCTDDTVPRPTEVEYELQLSFQKPDAKKYSCWVPTLAFEDIQYGQTPEAFIWEPNQDKISTFEWSPATLSIMEQKVIPSMRVLVRYHNGSNYEFYSYNNVRVQGNRLFIRVPSSGKFVVRVDYLSICQNCTATPNAHESWSNYSTGTEFTQNTTKTVPVNLGLLYNDGFTTFRTIKCGQ